MKMMQTGNRMGDREGASADLVSGSDATDRGGRPEMLAASSQNYFTVPADDGDDLQRYPLRTRAVIIVALVGGLWAIIWLVAQFLGQALG